MKRRKKASNLENILVAAASEDNHKDARERTRRKG